MTDQKTKQKCKYCDRSIHPYRMARHMEAFHPLELRAELEPLRTKWRKELGLPPLKETTRDRYLKPKSGLHKGWYIAQYKGWFLFGIIPLFINHGQWQKL